jgi:hypothetical protein
MKPKIKEQKTFDTVQTFRSIKEKISKDISKMTFEELKKYLEQNRLKTSK